MPDLSPRFRIKSTYLDWVLYALAILAGVPAPEWLSRFAIGGIFGPWLYLGTVGILIPSAIRLRNQEDKQRDREKQDHVDLAAKRAMEAKTRDEETHRTLSLLRAELKEGQEMTKAGLGELRQEIGEIAANPPTTLEAGQLAAANLNRLFLRVQTGVEAQAEVGTAILKITGEDGQITELSST